MLKKIMKNRKASETVEQLIVITIMGALAITAISAIATNIKGQNTAVLNSLQTSLSSASSTAGMSVTGGTN